MAKGEYQSSLFKDSSSTDDLHSDGEEGVGMCWFTLRGRGRWRFARLERKQPRWRVSRLTLSQATAGIDDSSMCCCCGPRWTRTNSKCTDNNGIVGAARDVQERSSPTKGNLFQKFASFIDSSSLRFTDGGRVSPALSPLPVRIMSKMERDKERQAFVPIWQRRVSMSPIKALDLRH